MGRPNAYSPSGQFFAASAVAERLETVYERVALPGSAAAATAISSKSEHSGGIS